MIMKARDELIDTFLSLGYRRPSAQSRADRILNTHAHELAEEQRDYAEEQWAGDDRRAVLRRLITGRVADLIDPKVEL